MMNVKKNVLIVDDVPDNIRIIASILNVLELSITFALDGQSALDSLSEQPFDLVLLDIMMPMQDGYSVCRAIKADDKTKHIPVIFITAKADTESLLEGFEAGGVDYIVKPFNSQELLARVKTQLRLKQSEDQLRIAAKVFDTANEGIYVTDTEDHILSVNPAFSEITGYSTEEAHNLHPENLYLSRHNSIDYATLKEALAQYDKWEGEIWQRRKDGSAFPAWMSSSVMRDEWGQVLRYVSVFNDITRSKQDQLLMEHRATHDPLTDLPNRALFQDRLLQAVRSAHRDFNHVAVLFVDLDKFKEVNDALGHDIGDELLVETAQRLQSCLRESDTVARQGGDEFTVLLVQVETLADAQTVAGKIVAQLAKPYFLREQKISISGSVGVSFYPEHGKNGEELLKHADQAMYQSKQLGRNRYCLFQD